MKRTLVILSVIYLLIHCITFADTFGTGLNQFTIDFVPISGSTNPTSGISAGNGFTFTGVANDYRMGKYEITNDQWNKFQAAYGEVAGTPTIGYDQMSHWPGLNLPANNVSWFEAAQFVNYLNTSKGYQAAYKFTGTKGTSNYACVPWSVGDTGYDVSNPYRHRNAYYFLPTENEWVKAAYWNGTTIQTWATPDGSQPVAGVDTNYFQSVSPGMTGPWGVNNGSEELNETFNMMGNILEWMENPYNNGEYTQWASRCLRGGSYYFTHDETVIASYTRVFLVPYEESSDVGIRVASIPEPCTLLLLGLGGMMIRKR